MIFLSPHTYDFFYFAVYHNSSMSSEGISSSCTTILCESSKPSKDIVYSMLFLLKVIMVPTNHPSQFPLASAVSTFTLLLRSEPFPVQKMDSVLIQYKKVLKQISNPFGWILLKKFLALDIIIALNIYWIIHLLSIDIFGTCIVTLTLGLEIDTESTCP